jgi:hypothetical protein
MGLCQIYLARANLSPYGVFFQIDLVFLVISNPTDNHHKEGIFV